MTYLAKSFRLGVLFETERREVHSRAEHLCLCQNTDTANTVNLHLHVWVTIGVAQVSQMRAPGCILCVTFHNDGVFVEGIRESESGLGFLPRV